MQTIGERLEEARKRLGIALREASEATKIRSDYLQQMENGTFDFPLPDVYKRGFLSIYARYLKLDPEPLITDYNAEHFGVSRSTKRESADHLGRVEAGSASAAASPDTLTDGFAMTAEENRAAIIRIVTVVGVVVVVVVLIYAGLQHLLNGSPGVESNQVGAATNSTTATNTPVASPAPRPASPLATKPPPAVLQLTFSAQSDIASLNVRQLSDHKPLYNGALKRGQSASVSSQGPVEITVSQTQFLVITQNGKALFAADSAGKPLTGGMKFNWPPGSTQ